MVAKCVRDQRRLGAKTRGRRSCLAARVAAADDNHIESVCTRNHGSDDLAGSAEAVKAMPSRRCRQMFHVKRYLPMQKSAKIRSRISSTSTAPDKRPSAWAATRRSSARNSTALAGRSPGKACSASRQDLSSWRWRCRVTAAGSPTLINPSAAWAADGRNQVRLSRPSPVFAEMRRSGGFRLRPELCQDRSCSELKRQLHIQFHRYCPADPTAER